MSPAASKPQTLSDEARVELLALVKQADSVELKLTIPEPPRARWYRAGAGSARRADPPGVLPRHAGPGAQRAGLVVRARRVQRKGDDSLVKLRPVVPTELPPELRESPGFVVEVDAMPGGFVCSGLVQGLPRTPVRDAAPGAAPLRKLFSKEQRAFFAAHAPEGVELDELSVLGPIFVLKLKVSPSGYGASS